MENDLIALGKNPANSPEELFKQYASYSELSTADRLEKDFENLTEEAIHLQHNYRAALNDIKESKKYTDEYKQELYKEVYQSFKKQAEELRAKQEEVNKKLNETKYNAVKGAYDTIMKEADISKLTEADISYIVAMKQADPSNENRKKLAEKYKYNSDVLDLLNAGITREGLKNATLSGEKAIKEDANNGKDSENNKNYGQTIKHPLSHAVAVYQRNTHTPQFTIKVTKSNVGIYMDQFIKYPNLLVPESKGGVL